MLLASTELKNDKNVVWIAVRENVGALEYASEAIKKLFSLHFGRQKNCSDTLLQSLVYVV